MMRKFILYFLVLCCTIQIVAQERTLQLICDNNPFQEGLECCFELSDNFGYKKEYYYPAIYNADKSKCSFTFPDSIFQKYSSCKIVKKDTLSTSCAFRIINDVDTTLYISSPLFWEDVDTMALQVIYEKQDTLQSKFSRFASIRYFIKKPSQEILLTLTGKHNDYVKYSKESREHLFMRYKKLIMQYPDSRSILQAVYGYYHVFSVEQLTELKSLFSKDLLQSYRGKELITLIDSRKGKFENKYLINSLTKEKETVIIDSKKYTLVIFSASWCAPCHKLIPILKELYSRKKDVIDFVYISLDEQKSQKAWKQLLEKEQIPWRALSVDDVTKIRQDYKVPVIPYSYLVSPAGNFQKLDVRDEKDLSILENVQL